MKNLFLWLFVCLVFDTQDINAQIPFQQESYLNLRVHYISGNQTSRENYKLLNPEKGKDAFLYLSEIQVKNCNCPTDLSKGLGIFKSFTLIGRWFNLLGEFAANPGIIYEYQDDFSFNENGVKYNINKKLLAKYPPLLKRLKYAAPTNMNYTLRLNAKDKLGSESGIELMVKDIDLLIPAENEMPYMVAGAPSKWSDRIIIGNYINQNEIENKKRWATLTEVSNQVSLVINNLTLPVDELIAISNLYKQYEKENKELKEEFKMLEPEYKPAVATKPYVKTDDWSKPYEPEVRTARVFNENGKVGLRSGSKILFESNAYVWADSLPGSSKFFRFRTKTGGFYHLLNAKGRKVMVGGFDQFYSITKSKQEAGYEIVIRSNNKSYVYKTLMQYSDVENYYSDDNFEKMKQRDRFRYNESLEPVKDNGMNQISIGYIRYRWFFYNASILTTDENLRILSTEPGYIGDRN